MQNVAHPLVFLRHGETDWNELGRYQGTNDTRLSSRGLASATANAGLIQKLIIDNTLDATKISLITSPLKRAVETALIIQNGLDGNLSPVEQPEFRELSVGRWEGLNSQQVKDRFYKERQGRKLDRWNFKPRGGESMAERSSVIAAALAGLSSNSIVVTHSVVLRVVFNILGGQSMEEAAQAEIPHIGLMIWDGAILHRQVD